jgi:hypothetical protein
MSSEEQPEENGNENQDEEEDENEITTKKDMLTKIENEMTLRRLMTRQERFQRVRNSLPSFKQLFPNLQKRLSF